MMICGREEAVLGAVRNAAGNTSVPTARREENLWDQTNPQSDPTGDNYLPRERRVASNGSQVELGRFNRFSMKTAQ